jgi:hypothetical protein
MSRLSRCNLGAIGSPELFEMMQEEFIRKAKKYIR